MKKLQIQVSDEVHLELLSIQLEKKKKKQPRTTLIQVASDVFEEMFQEKIRQRSEKNV